MKTKNFILMTFITLSLFIKAETTFINLETAGTLSNQTYTDGNILVVKGKINVSDFSTMKSWISSNSLRKINLKDAVIESKTVNGKDYLENEIPEESFNATLLEFIIIPTSTTKINSNAFNFCMYLTKFICYNTVPPTIDASVFMSLNPIPIYCPKGCLTAYTNAGYSSVSEMTTSSKISLTTSGTLSSQTYNEGDSLILDGKLNSSDITTMKNWVNNNNLQIIDLSATEIESLIANGTTYPANQLPKDAFNSCTSLLSCSLPSSLISLNNACFKNCTNLSSTILVNSIMEIGNSAFYGCGLTHFEMSFGLKSVKLRKSLTLSNSSALTTISDSAFMLCTKLKRIYLPSSLTTVGKSAFESCTALDSIISYNTIPPTLGTNAFKNLPSTAITICPTGTLNAYLTAGYPSPKETAVATGAFQSDIDSKVNVFPNPATDKITISVNSESSVILTNQLGQVVLTDKVSETKTIDVSSFPRGLYILKIGNSQQKIVLK